MGFRRTAFVHTALTVVVLGIGLSATVARAQSGKAVVAVLKTRLDTKNASVGHAVTAKTIGDVTLPNGTALPVGSVLMGTVEKAESRSAGNGEAALLITFQKAMPAKTHTPIAVHGELIAVAPQPNLSDSGPTTSDLPMASTRSVGDQAARTGSSDAESISPSSMQMGSTLKGVRLDSSDGSLTSAKDIKLTSGTRLAIAFR